MSSSVTPNSQLLALPAPTDSPYQGALVLKNNQVTVQQHQKNLQNLALNDLDAEEVGKVVIQLQEEIKIIKLQLENLPGYNKDEVPEHLIQLKLELEKTFQSLEGKNEMLIDAMTKNFGKTHQDLPDFHLPPIHNQSKKQALFALQAPTDTIGEILPADPKLKAKGANILKPTASNNNKNGPYKAKKSLGPIMRQRQIRELKRRMVLDEQEEMMSHPPISEEDINKGMMDLLNRGIIPKDVDLTPAFEKGAPPVQFKSMKFHDPKEKYAKYDIHTEKFNRNSLKFDMAQASATYAMSQHKSSALVPLDNSSQIDLRLALPPIQEIPENKGLLMLTGVQSTIGEQSLKRFEDQSKQVQKDSRGYNELMDEFSLHQLIFRKGKLLDQTPEFASFRRTFIDRWGPISFILMHFEKVFTDNEVPIAYVNGRKLVALANDQLNKPSKDELFDCITNQEEVSKLIKAPHFMFKGPEGPVKASVVVQKNWRMFKARESYRHLLFLMRKAMIIQKRVKIYLYQKLTKDRVEEINNENLFVWREMMDDFKAKWPTIRSQKRIEIHINSLSIYELQRISMNKFLQRENSQLARVLAVRDPNVEVIYVSPFQMTSDVLGYYLKILEIGDVEQAQKRLHFVVPDNVNKFPDHFSLSQLLLYSPKTIKKIKNLMMGKQAYIVPGIVSSDDIKLSIRLAVPILCGDPAKQQLYSTKSGAKKIFQLADVPTPICSVDIYDEQEFIVSLAQLIAKNLYVTTWIFKIDDEFNGRGHAYLNVDQIKSLQTLKRKQIDPNFNLVEQIKPILAKNLPKKVVIAVPSLFRNWQEYLASFCRVGGIIEAAPTCLSHQMASPSIAFTVNPDGMTEIVGSFDRIAARSYVNSGCFFPQKSLPNMNMMTICKSIGDVLYDKGVIGHVTLDLVAFPDPTSPNSHPLFWAIDLNCNLTDYASACFFFDFLMEGKLDQITGKYEINTAMGAYHGKQRIQAAESTDDGSQIGNEEYQSEDNEFDNFDKKSNSNKKLNQSKISSASSNQNQEKTNRSGKKDTDHRRNFSQQRSFMYCKFIAHPGLAKIQYKSFFHMCRLQSISFDLESRKGTTFMLQDCLQSGVIALMTISEDRRDTLSMMADVFKFIEQQAGIANDLKEVGNQLDESRSDDLKIADVISSIRLLHKMQKKQEEKAKMLRYGATGSSGFT